MKAQTKGKPVISAAQARSILEEPTGLNLAAKVAMVTELAKEPEEESVPSVLSLDAALGVLRYLEARKVLCTGCGYRLSTKENTYYAFCESCAEGCNQTLNPRLKKVSQLDQVLCAKLTRWAEAVIQGNW